MAAKSQANTESGNVYSFGLTVTCNFWVHCLTMPWYCEIRGKLQEMRANTLTAISAWLAQLD